MDEAVMDDTALAPRRHRIDVDDYYRMASAGILGFEERVELIAGDIYDMAPIGTGHASRVDRLNRALFIACGDRAIVRVRNPVRLDRWSEPEPDFAVLRPRPDWYVGGHPGPADVLLLIEVADSSLRFDRKIKLPLYAAAGIGEVWVVDLVHRAVHFHRDPRDGAYTTEGTHELGATVTLALDPEITVSLAGLFG